MATPMTAAQFKAALKAEGVHVTEHAGWATHNRAGHGAWGPLNGVMMHHTGSTESGIESVVYNGRSDLPGPLCHGLIHKDGTVELIGWGRANHAGGGDPDVLAAVVADKWPVPKTNEHEGSSGSVDGNPHFVGFECVNVGDGKDPWPAVQLEAMARAAAAVLRHYGWSENSVIRHLDWSDWKPDPKGVDWTKFRARVKALLAASPGSGAGTVPPPTSEPSQPPSGTAPRDPGKVTGPPKADEFPGADKFGPGKSGPQVTRLGQMLVARGGKRFYTVGPGPTWGDADRHATQAFQKAQGWTGEDADGLPGTLTWNLLVTGGGKDIPPAAPAKPVVSLANVVAASRRDPGLPQGGTTHPADVKPVEAALKKLGFLAAAYASDGSFGTTTVAAYNAFRRSIGLKGADATGDPGKSSLATLGTRSGLFTVKN